MAHPRDAADVIMRGMLSGDADAIAALYTPNAVYLAPDSPMISGRDAIRGVYQRHLDAGRSRIRFFDVKIDQADSRALIVWSWTSEIVREAAEAIRMEGRSMVYMVRGDDGWQISVDMLQTLPHGR
ncbi:nuclear transport factor 2 family protein [Hyphomicrobium sp.]|uniref:YybH family protein n=1 Tax=Hyphomicrobium sp. TaxID=82 RepID=UPI002CB84B49|nr:nuclear transport factor 2 family protein [Hyphomicrobium sp.]HRN87334.1 nuclear transport factor 2 family protein [Hyphomicrobium sp.]HRQ26321.1 nuclear transport factor 2 family protein [Hyphomicrobium sp.]